MIKEFQKLLEPLRNRLLLILGKAIVTAVNDDKAIQQLQVSLLKGELKDNIKHYQNYGFTSVPHPGAEGVAIFNGGNRNSGVVVCVDDQRFRLKSLKPGEVAIYTDEGDSILFKRRNNIKIKTKSFNVDTESLHLKCDNINISNGKDDLIQILSEWMNEIVNATVQTSQGPAKIIGEQLPSIKSKLEKFKR